MSDIIINLSVVKRDGHRYATLVSQDDAGEVSTRMRLDDDGRVSAVLRGLGQGSNDVDAVIAAFDVGDDPSKRHAIEDEVVEEVNSRLEAMSDHVRIDRDHALYDNDPFEDAGLSQALEDHLVRLFRQAPEDADAWRGWVRFCERLHANVSDDVRRQLFRWLDAQGWLTLTPNGMLVGYRGGAPSAEYGMVSVHEGPAIVDGRHVDGHVPNPVGAVVEMPRSQVTHDPYEGCSSGLHVGTYDYARSWSRGPIAKVAVDPADIVSVPYDCGAKKIRCCRFRVLEIDEDAVTNDWAASRDVSCDDGYDDYDDDCDEDEDCDW